VCRERTLSKTGTAVRRSSSVARSSPVAYSPRWRLTTTIRGWSCCRASCGAWGASWRGGLRRPGLQWTGWIRPEMFESFAPDVIHHHGVSCRPFATERSRHTAPAFRALTRQSLAVKRTTQSLPLLVANLALCWLRRRSRVGRRIGRRSARIAVQPIGEFVRPGGPDAVEDSDTAAGAAPSVCR
jgi:hypothetical protein